MRGPPLRRYVQVGAPLLVAAVFVVPLWLRGSDGQAATTLSSPLGVRTVNEPLPAIEGPTLTGERFDGTALRGRVAVINVWNPDCPPCRQEAPVLAQAWKALGHRPNVAMIGLMFIGGDWPDDRTAARRFAQ